MQMAHVVGVAEILEMKIFCTLSNQVSINVRHYRVAAVTGVTVTDLSIALALSPVFATPYKAMLAAPATYKGVSIQVIKPVGFDAQFSSVGNGSGTGGDEALPPSNAGLIKLSTGLAGRKGRGRAYVPFPSESASNDQGECTTGYVTALDTLGTAFIATQVITAGGGTADLIPVLYNRVLGTGTTLTQRVSRGFFATQRRRTYLRHGDLIPAG